MSLTFKRWVYMPALFIGLFLLTVSLSTAQTNQASEMASNAEKTNHNAAPAPALREYKGIAIGMPVAKVRESVQRYLKAKGDKQDFLVFSEQESGQVYYNDKGEVTAISIDYIGQSADSPTPMKVLGIEVQPKPDGSIYALQRYPDAGYWVSYNRTSGDKPIITVTMQSLN